MINVALFDNITRQKSYTARPEQRGFQVVACARWCTGSAGQRRHPGAQGRIQPFNIRGLDAVQHDLRHLHDRFSLGQMDMRLSPCDTDQPSTDPLLDDMQDVQILLDT